MTLAGSGSSTIQGATLTYAWTQTSGASVSLSDAAAQSPTFTAPSAPADLEFSLVVNDGSNDSAPDTVAVTVRPPLNPTSAPCPHPAPAGTNFVDFDLFDVTSTTDTTIAYTPRGTPGQETDLWFCWPDGTRQERATDKDNTYTETVSGLSSGTNYWLAANFGRAGFQANWQNWVRVTTTGGASIRGVSFSTSPAEGDTYRIGETIRAEVTWSQAVTVDAMGDDANVSLRLDLGADDTDPTNSRRKMAYVSGTGTDTLTFEYTVQHGETDADGVWLQTFLTVEGLVVFRDTVVSLQNGATLTGGNPDTNNAVLTKSGLPTTGDAAHKVDGVVNLWSATLTAKEVISNRYGCYISSAHLCSDTSVLTEDSFTYDGVDYQVETLMEFDRFLFGLDKAFPQALVDNATLFVDGTPFVLSDGTVTENKQNVFWDDTGLTWAAGQVVSVTLTLSSALARAGPDQEALFGATVTLEGSGSSTLASLTYTYAVESDRWGDGDAE